LQQSRHCNSQAPGAAFTGGFAPASHWLLASRKNNLSNYGAGILAAGKARARSISAAIGDEPATPPAAKRTSQDAQVVFSRCLCGQNLRYFAPLLLKKFMQTRPPRRFFDYVAGQPED
jgi:hypothetical protein